MSKKYIDIEVYDGDDDIKYVRHQDMLNLLEQIRIKQEGKDKEIERLNNNNQAMQEEMARTWKKHDELQQRIDKAIEYIEWHYDLGTKENIEFCLLRDRLLEILDKGKE